jgi:hypothetical protein
MQGHLQQVIRNPINLFGALCLCILLFFHEASSVYYYLTIAQLLYIPIVIQCVVVMKRWQKVMLCAGQVSVTMLYFTEHQLLSILGATIYFLCTCSIAWSGIQRFLHRGFINRAELMIDIGFVYIVMGGLWFFAHIVEIHTGFSPMITWLTAIHFHYSACLLCITVGLLGRIKMNRLYTFSAAVIALGPLMVAVGITFSRIIEIIAVTFYVVAIFSLTYFVCTTAFNRVAIQCIRLAFLTLCFTIIWSFLYAYSNLTNSDLVDIPSMLDFHGILNCFLFGGAITIAWATAVPPSKQLPFTFPKSKLRHKVEKPFTPHSALVDDMSIFIYKEPLPERIYRFYEETNRFELQASVKWASWFKPFAFLYQFIGHKMQQLNLPYPSKAMKMEGDLLQIDEAIDGRLQPRVWHRKVGSETIFYAIYATHKTDERAYMNIALPLPYSVMHGILTVRQQDQKLLLTSDDVGDAGTYLSFSAFRFRLPLHEYFTLWEEKNQLYAIHQMKLFGLHFLTIQYEIREVEHPE